MRYAAAYVLAILAGNSNPNASTISKILGSVGIDCDNIKAQKIVNACQGKDIEQLIVEGTKKLASLPTDGGAATANGGAGTATTDANQKNTKEETKKEETKKEESDDDGDDMVCIFKDWRFSIFILNIVSFSYSF